MESRFSHPPDRLPVLVADLISLSPDVLIVAAPQATQALKSATAIIPIVFVLWPIPWDSASCKVYRDQAET
jgi:putative ABC transport system substrate-binding protein